MLGTHRGGAPRKRAIAPRGFLKNRIVLASQGSPLTVRGNPQGYLVGLSPGRTVRRICRRLCGGGPLFPLAHVAPPAIERRAAAVPDTKQKPHAFAACRVFGQATAVAAACSVPIQVGATLQVAVEDVRLHARVRQATPAAPDAGQGTQVRGRRAAWPVTGPGSAGGVMDGMASWLLWRPRDRSGTLLALRFPGTVCRFGCLAKRFRVNSSCTIPGLTS